MLKKIKEFLISLFDSLCATLNIPDGKARIATFIIIVSAFILIPLINFAKDWSFSNNNQEIKTEILNNEEYEENNPKLLEYYKDDIRDAYPFYPFYPISIDMKDTNEIGEWTYFIHDVSNKHSDTTNKYPALFKCKNEEAAIRVSPRACYSYQIVNGSVFYLDSTTAIQDHGELYVSRPDGKNERLLDDELYKFQIIDNKYIYYVYRHDTLGVGLEGHALYRINLDGSDKMIVAYEVSGAGFGSSHFDFEVKGDWVYYGNSFKMKLGTPASGLEKIELLSETNNYEDDYIYYITNRLIKAKKDGSSFIELDGIASHSYEIKNIDSDWIYYTKDAVKFKIKKDGTEKEKYNY
ncbi:MAG: DUF5050 domain-containing protein [Erysipelotrichaceae bacterium]